MKIFSYCYNKPEYLLLQNKCLRKFIKEPFEFYCIDNSKEIHFENQFKEICKNNNIHYVKNGKPDHSLEGTSHYSALQWSYDNIISKTSEIIVMIDHDNFLIRPVSIEKILGDAHIAGGMQSRGHVYYLNPCLMIMNTATMPDKTSLKFKGRMIEGFGTDVGGELYFYLKKTNVNRKELVGGIVEKNNPILLGLEDKYGYPHTFDFIEGAFLHPRNGANWARVPALEHGNREKLILEILAANL